MLLLPRTALVCSGGPRPTLSLICSGARSAGERPFGPPSHVCGGMMWSGSSAIRSPSPASPWPPAPPAAWMLPRSGPCARRGSPWQGRCLGAWATGLGFHQPWDARLAYPGSALRPSPRSAPPIHKVRVSLVFTIFRQCLGFVLCFARLGPCFISFHHLSS